MINIFADRPTIVIARQDIAFVDCGVSANNTYLIIRVGEPFLSYDPSEDVNPISGFEKGQAYFYFAKTNIDLEGIADNSVPDDLSAQPGNNVFAGKAFAGIALQTIDFATVGFNASNLQEIFLVGNPYKSYVPDADINAIDGFEIGQPYYGYALADMDLSAYLIPPIVVSTDIEQSVEPYHYYGTEATTDKSYYKVPVRFFDNEASLPATGEENIIYVAKAENTSSYWDGAAYVQIGGGTSYSDEQAQDAVGTILTDSDTVDFSYDDATPAITADVKKQMSLTSDSSGLKLSGDSATPGTSKYYGTDSGGTKGFFALPSSGLTSETDPLSWHLTGTSTLTGNTTIAGGANSLQFTSTANSTAVLSLSGTGSSQRGLDVSIAGGNAVNAKTTGLAYGGSFEVQRTTGSSVLSVLAVIRSTTGSPGSGIGAQIDFIVQTTTGNQTAVQLISKWLDATGATRTSALEANVVDKGNIIKALSLQAAILTTTDATPTTLKTLSITDETAGIVEVVLVGRESGTAGKITAKKIVGYRKDGGILTLDSVTDILPTSATGTIGAATCQITTSSNNIIIQVTGVAATTINWKCTVNQIDN